MRNYITRRDRERGANAPWKIPRKVKKHGRKKVLQHFFQSFSCDEKPCHIRRCANLSWVPMVGWTLTVNTVWVERFKRRRSKEPIVPVGVLEDRQEDFDEYFDSEYDDFDDWGDESDGHGWDCDCDECTDERDTENCGELPPHLGGGCSQAGSEYCDFECPFRDRVMNGGDDDE